MELDIPEVDNLLFVISSWDVNKDLVDENQVIKTLEDDYTTLLQYSKQELEDEDEKEAEKEALSNTNLVGKSVLEKLKTKYSSIEEYITTQYNLFIIECKAQITRSRLMELEASELFVVKDGKLEKKFFILEFTKTEKSESIAYSAGDLVIVSKERVYQNKQCPNDHALAVIDKSFPSGVSLKISMNFNNEKIAGLIKIVKKGVELNITRVCNLATNIREYQALMSLDNLLLTDLILHPGEINNINLDKVKDFFYIPDQLDKKIKEYFDFSQYEALKASIRKKGVTLIQGPPGTGKSTTILGILSVILNSQNNPVSKASKLNKENIEISTNKKNKESGRKNKTNCNQTKELIIKSQPWIYDPNYSDWLDEPILDDNYSFLTDSTKTDTSSSNNKNENDNIDKKIIFPNCHVTDNFIQLNKNSDDDISPPERILVCAPSNVAIDEIVRKLINQGLFKYDGEKYMPKFVRIGPNYHPSIEEYCLDYMVNKKIENNEVKEIEKLKQEILLGVKIVCSTLSIAGSNTLLTLNQKFDTVIIDEAGQSIEISSLIPLKYNCERLILVGDPKQLSSTVFSKTAIKYNYDLSLFKRFQDAGQEVVILKTQYRMNPYLSKFISETFYDGKLMNAKSIIDSSVQIFEKTKLKNKALTNSDNDIKKNRSSNNNGNYEKCLEHPAFQPFVFFDIESKENYDNNSCYNDHQVQFVLELVRILITIYPNTEELYKKVAIISPYSTQVLKIKHGLRKVLNYTEICPLDVNTVDGFQGKEKDIVIFSTVRSKGSKSIGFLKDEKRVNVGLSRAKSSLVVVGDSKKLILDTNWEKLVKYSYREGLFYKVFGNVGDYLKNLESELIKDDSIIRVKTDEEFVRAVYSGQVLSVTK